MIPPELDSYNSIVKHEDIEKSYRIFKQLLKPEQNHSKLEQEILAVQLTENPLHRVIKMDCHRTRSTNFDVELKKKLQYFLSYFTKVQGIEYKQGLNQIAAPFILWNQIGVPLGQCYKMFEKFFTKFSLNFYYDRNFTGLEMFFRMISIVLRYHCPELSRYLQIYDIEPQIYAMSWLMTLFSSKLSLKMTYLLWSYLIAENDRYLLFFIVVGIIIKRKNDIIQTQNSSIFRIVTDLIFKGEEELVQVMRISLVLRKNTPTSLTTFFQQKQLFDRMQSYKDSAQLLEHINKSSLFLILPKELYLNKTHSQSCQKSQCTICSLNESIKISKQLTEGSVLANLIEISNDLRKISKSIQYVIIDLRKQKSKLNSFTSVHSVDISLPFEQIQSSFLNNFMQSKLSKHFIILLTGFTFEDVSFSDPDEFKCARKFLQVLNSYSFPYLGILEGGFTALSIFEQESTIKEQFQSQLKNKTQKIQPHLKSKNQSLTTQQFNQNILSKGQHELTLPLSILFQIAQLKYSHKLKFFYGLEKTLTIVTDCFMIVIEEKQGFLMFMSFLEHNCSIIPYLFSNFKNPICRVLKVLPICKVSEIKIKKDNENMLLIKCKSNRQKINQRPNTIKIKYIQKYESTEFPSYLIECFRQIIPCRQFVLSEDNPKQQAKQVNQIQNNIFIQFRDAQTATQMSTAVQKAYKCQLRKKYLSSKKQ